MKIALLQGNLPMNDAHEWHVNFCTVMIAELDILILGM